MKIAALMEGRSTLVDQVCRKLTGVIRQEMTDGDLMLPPERDLAAQFGVSRPVVREATKRLELQGLLEVRQGIGTRVVDRLHAPLTGSIALLVDNAKERLRQSLEVRLALEPQVASHAAERATTALRRRLQAVHDRLAAASELDAAIEADLEFHRALAEAAHNDIFALVLNSMADLGRVSRQETISHAGVETACKHHAEILAAVLKGDARAAETIMRQHIQAAIADLAAATKRKR